MELNHPHLLGRVNQIYGGNESDFSDMKLVSSIPVPDSVVLCNGCNRNIAEAQEAPMNECWFLYMSKRDLDKGKEYDCYCGVCIKRYFPKAVKVA